MGLPFKFLLLFFFSLSAILGAQNPQPAFRNYTTDQGLASHQVYIALQDSKGYMWFGSDHGLSRFDGYAFRNYGSADGLDYHTVFDLQEDKQGRIWIMTMSGNVYYHYRDSIYPFLYNDTIQLFKERNQFRMGIDLYFDDADQSLYLALQHTGILRIKPDGTYQQYKSQYPDALVALKFNDRLLYAHSRLSDDEVSSFRDSLEMNNNCAPVEIQGDNKITIWPEGCTKIGSSDFALFTSLLEDHYLYENHGFINLFNDQVSMWVRQFNTDIINIYMDHKEAIFFCFTNEQGALFFENLEDLEKKKGHILLKEHSAVNMAQDNSRGYWFTTLEKGVFYTPGMTMQIYDQQLGLTDAYVTAFEVKNDSTLFISLWNTDIYELNILTHQLKKLPAITAPRQGMNQLFYDQQSNILFSGSSLHYFKQNQWKLFEDFDKASGNIFNYDFKGLAKSNNKRMLWIIGSSSLAGLKLDSLILHRIPVFIGDKTRIFSAYEDKNGQLWLGRADGLWQTGDGDTLIQAGNMHPAFHYRIEDIKGLPDSSMVVGTKGRGIVIWKGDLFKEVTALDGLTSNMIRNLYIEENGTIWAGTLLGLNKIIPQSDGTYSVQNITMQHGLPSNEINQVQVIGDEVWVATTRGLVRFPYGRAINMDSKPPFIEKVLVNGESISRENTDLDLGYQENSLSIQYLCINFQQQGKIPYRYRLVPGQENWITTQSRTANLSALNDGRYTFEVQSQNEDGYWSTSAVVPFSINPPFWETWWFLGLIAAILGFIAYRAYKYRTDQLKKEARVIKQMAELERSALRAQMNPHFIFNCLNSISNFINKGDKRSANSYLSTFAKLIRGALNHSRSERISLEDELQLLKNYMKLEQLRFEQRFEYNIELGDNVEPFEIQIPPMMVQPFIENAIKHGLSKKGDKGRIDLRYELQNTNLKVTIIDNGIGIEQSKKLKSAGKSLHKSVGMTITQKRLEMISGTNGQGRFEIEEVKNAQGVVAGTKVLVWIPLSR